MLLKAIISTATCISVITDVQQYFKGVLTAICVCLGGLYSQHIC
jgi:hypothetical protein